MFIYPIVRCMKWQAIIVLAAIALSIVIPPSLPLLSDNGAQAAIGTLDVCHSAIPALSSSGEMPCVGECSCHLSPLSRIEVLHTANPICKLYLISFQDERPPKA